MSEIKDTEKIFIELIRNDINVLDQGIKENYMDLYNAIKKIHSSESKYRLKISQRIFNFLVNTFCFSGRPLLEFPKDEDLNIADVPEDRFKLFQEIFIKDLKRIDYLSTTTQTRAINLFVRPQKYYYNLLYNIYHKLVNDKTSSVDTIFSSFLSDWNEIISNKKTEVLFKILLDNTYQFNHESLNNHHLFQFKSEVIYLVSSLNPFINYPLIEKCLVYRKKIPINIPVNPFGFSSREHHQLSIKGRELISDIDLYLCALFISGVNIIKEKQFLDYNLWVMVKDEDLYQKFDYFVVPRDDRQITEEIYKNSIETYDNLIRKNINSSKCVPLLYGLKEITIKHLNFIEWILNAHIIVEYLFAPGKEGELSYRISQNAAFFLSEDITSFKENFYFFREIYVLRSGIIHGGTPDINKTIKRLNERTSYDVKKLENIIEIFQEKLIKIIKKIIDTAESFPRFKKLMEGNPLYFLENTDANFNK